MKKIDTHCHAFPDFLAEKAINQLSEHSGSYKPFTDGTIKSLIEQMEKNEVEKAFIANIATKPEQAKAITAWSKEIHSKQIIPLGSIHPDSKNWIEEIDQIEKSGLPGIKLHPMYQNFTVDENKMLPIYEYIANKNLFILFHAGYDIAFPGDKRATPEKFINIKRMLPELIIITAHLGGWQTWKENIEYITGNDIYIETSFIDEIEENLFYELIRKHDNEKILFGSDTPWTDIKKQIASIEYFKLPYELKYKIFYENAINLLKRVDYDFR